MDFYRNILFGVFSFSLLILIKFGIKKFIFCLVSLAFGYIAAHYAFLTNIRFFDTNSHVRKKRARDANREQYAIQEVRHIKSLKKSSTSNSIKISSSSSSISSLPEAKKTTTAATAKNGRPASETCNLEFYFRRTYPWQSVYLPPNVDKAFEDLLSPVIQEYILTWYSKISKDDGLIFEIKNLFRHILANLIVRSKELDLNHFLVYKTNTLVYNHLSDFIQVYKTSPELIEQSAAKLKALSQKERVDKQFSIFKATIQKSTEPFNHFALSSRRNELAYLRKMCSQVLPFLLPDSIIKCRASYELVQEIAVSILILPVLDVISRPATINKLIGNMLREGESLIIKKSGRAAENKDRIQLLKHWSQMNGCIFKSIQTPSFNDLIENNEHLCIFINYLNSVNSLSILQFYLMIKDILKTYNELASVNDEEGQSSNVNSPNVASQIEELKAWCKNNRPMLETITFDHKTSYYSLLAEIISSDSINDDITKTILQKTYLELNSLIRDTYYTSFIKSDFIYKNLYGLQRLNTSPLNKSPISQRKNKDSLLSPPISASSMAGKLLDNQQVADNNANNKEDTFSLSNNDIEIDDFEYKTVQMSPSDATNKSDIPAAVAAAAGSISSGTGGSGENEDEDEPEIPDDYDVETYSTGSAKLSSEVRLDLINEINDEFLDEELGSNITDKQQPQSGGVIFGQQFSLDDEEDNTETASKKPIDLTSLINENNEEDGEDDDDDTNLNLGNLRVTIDGLDEITAGENAGYAFVISVWNLDPKIIARSSGGDSPSWFVKRKYDEFYVLDSRLRQFHGESLASVGSTRPLSSFQLPPKPRAILSFSNKENNLEYLESVQNDFERYLQSLLSNPILSKSKLIKSFLDPARIEFNSSLLNNITNIGKMVKGVPYKLRVERGQSLDSFLAYLFKTIRQQKPKSSQTSVVYEDITEKSLNLNEFSNPEKNKTILKKTNLQNNATENSKEYLVSPFESFMFLIRHIYVLPTFICLLLFSLRKLIDKLFDYIIYWFVSRKVNELTTPEAIEQFIFLLKEVIFDKEEPKNENYYESAYKSLNSFITKNKLYALAQKLIAEDLFQSTFDDGTVLFLEAFQYPILNKNLIYKLLDALMIEIFPELGEFNNQPKLTNNST